MAENKLGVTHAIRTRLNFTDERLWKRFSARRLELIDTLALSSRKASEQEDQINNVALMLRQEFEYSDEYSEDFNKLVRAAVQSARRNRKRISKTRRTESTLPHRKPVIEGVLMTDPMSTGTSLSPPALGDAPNGTLPGFKEALSAPLKDSIDGKGTSFVSEISKLNSDSQDDLYDLNYSRTQHFSIFDKSKAAIDSLVRPIKFPSLSNGIGGQSHRELQAARSLILNYIEKSKTCSESTTKWSDNLEALGKSIFFGSVALTLEKSFENVNDSSREYLREKLTLKPTAARIFRELDVLRNALLNDDIALVSFHTILGSCVKDYGFDAIVSPLCDILFYTVLWDYPLISRSARLFCRLMSDTESGLRSPEIRSSEGPLRTDSLNSLAAVASNMHVTDGSLPPLQRGGSPSIQLPLEDYNKKKVTLRYSSSSLEFNYPASNNTPTYLELLENAKSAFKLGSTSLMGIKNTFTGSTVTNDTDLEKIFNHQGRIDLELFKQDNSSVQINELRSAVLPNDRDPPKIMLPHPYHTPFQQRDNPIDLLSKSNSPQPRLLPKFQRLL